MPVERTLSILKPDAIERNLIGTIYHRIETAGLRITAAKMIHLSKERAGRFYAEHEGKFFYNDLVEFMTSGPVMVQVVEGKNAIDCYRELMGNTNPVEASSGTLRADYATSINCNTVHGSDSYASAEREIAYFFACNEIYPRKP
ncbi:nucleoside-diphosphate kinase [Candidatus Enterovibrio altilux]|uniref:nucleoside-diphosphate kinase n=1 Tax=Candidatus Enterovibrio altilux TaxID=1927128 RepID=UPI000BBC9745|nr:nucleoside-diphosphate kinase [Candidatus Enterovibrio luxaltus]